VQRWRASTRHERGGDALRGQDFVEVRREENVDKVREALSENLAVGARNILGSNRALPRLLPVIVVLALGDGRLMNAED